MTKLDNAYPDPWQLVAELRAENERLRVALTFIAEYGASPHIHPADKARIMWQKAEQALAEVQP